MDFYEETVPHSTQSVLTRIQKLPDLKQFYLSGGTALSLQLGHRESEDLDFFTKEPFTPELLVQKLSSYGNLDDVVMSEGTLNLFIDKVKLQFLYYPYDLLEELVSWNDIYLSSVIDIACTKLITISSRGSKKDFIDLYMILQQITLDVLFKKLEEKYKKIEYNSPHILKSLVYFADADIQPMPKMHISLDWEEVKDSLIKQVKQVKF
jgi:hypothetical protein